VCQSSISSGREHGLNISGSYLTKKYRLFKETMPNTMNRFLDEEKAELLTAQNKYHTEDPHYKIYLPRRPGTRDFCTPAPSCPLSQYRDLCNLPKGNFLRIANMKKHLILTKCNE
jgi:hypothetical protein